MSGKWLESQICYEIIVDKLYQYMSRLIVISLDVLYAGFATKCME
jgi:hypothetical protein